MPGNIRIRRIRITDCEADCIVNPANNRLRRGSGLCGEIFREAGSELLTKECSAIGWCEAGEAVITPGFNLRAKYIIHTVGPVWHGGFHHELQKLYSCYGKSLLLAQENHCHSIVFPLLLTGVFNNPVGKAWKIALEACRNYLDDAGDYNMDICFAIADKETYDIGYRELGAQSQDQYVFFSAANETNGYMAGSYPCRFTVEGMDYCSADQYVASRKALLAGDLSSYQKVMKETDPQKITALMEQISGADEKVWQKAYEEILHNAVKAKFAQNDSFAKRLKQTGTMLLAENDTEEMTSTLFDTEEQLGNRNLMGKVLMKVREELSIRQERS